MSHTSMRHVLISRRTPPPTFPSPSTTLLCHFLFRRAVWLPCWWPSACTHAVGRWLALPALMIFFPPALQGLSLLAGLKKKKTIEQIKSFHPSVLNERLGLFPLRV